jgi:hypothetical protein
MGYTRVQSMHRRRMKRRMRLYGFSSLFINLASTKDLELLYSLIYKS